MNDDIKLKMQMPEDPGNLQLSESQSTAPEMQGQSQVLSKEPTSSSKEFNSSGDDSNEGSSLGTLYKTRFGRVVRSPKIFVKDEKTSTPNWKSKYSNKLENSLHSSLDKQGPFYKLYTQRDIPNSLFGVDYLNNLPV
jgi:hypothetical protein